MLHHKRIENMILRFTKFIPAKPMKNSCNQCSFGHFCNCRILTTGLHQGMAFVGSVCIIPQRLIFKEEDIVPTKAAGTELFTLNSVLVVSPAFLSCFVVPFVSRDYELEYMHFCLDCPL